MSDKRIVNVTLPTDTDVASILPTNEMVGLMLTAGAQKSDLQDLQKNPGAFLNAQYDVSVPENFSVTIVENSDKQVHIALPCYESFDSMDVNFLSDEQVKQVSGGEIIFFLIPALIGAKIAAVVGATAATASVSVAVGIGVATGTATFATAVAVPASAGVIAAGAAVGAAIGGGVAAGVGTVAGAAVTAAKKGK